MPANGLRPRTLETTRFMFRSQIDICENPAGSNKVKFNTWYYNSNVSGSAYPWCVTFVNTVLRKMCGFTGFYRTASCSALLARYKRVSPEQVITDGVYMPGDLVLFDFSGARKKTQHIGFVDHVSDDGKTLYCIEGNTSETSQDNGGRVMLRERPVKNVTAAIRIKYNEG